MTEQRYFDTRYGYVTNWIGEACISVDLNSGYSEHKPHLSIIVGKVYVLLYMPKWTIAPRRRRVQANWDAATVARMGRDWYYDETRRQVGVSVSLRDMRVHYGVQPDSWPGDKSAMWSFPWMKLRHVRFSLYDLNGEPFWSQHDRDDIRGMDRFAAQHEAEKACPKMVFKFEDYDGEPRIATPHIEEREWRHGDGRFKWISWFRKPRISRSLAVNFDKEVGYEKGSWKGGFMGGSIEMEPGELHASAFARFCAKGIRNKNGVSPLKLVGAANVEH
jgi:hypothetical protein